MRFLIFTTDLPPIKGFPTSGTALRTYNLGLGLKDLGHDVIFSPPKDAVEKFTAANDINSLPEAKKLLDYAFDASNQANIISSIKPDAIICGHWPAWTLGRKPSQPLIIDLAGPHLLERHFQGENDYQGAVLGKLNVLACADYFIVSGQKQKLYFLSFMIRAKIPNPEERICVVPMPLPQSPLAEGETDQINNKASIQETNNPKFIFGGVFLPWQNPSWGLDMLADQLEIRKRGHLTMIGGPHPHYPIDSGIYKTLFKKLGSNPLITTKGLLPYDEFQEEMQGKDVALDLMQWNLERELAITIRSCTYLWAGIPIIYNDYADLSSLIRKYDAGWCLAPGDEQGFIRILDEIYSSPLILKKKREGALLLAKATFDRTKNARDILKLLETPSIPLSEEIDIAMDHAENCDLFLSNSTKIVQKFTSRINGLTEVKTMLGTHGKNSTHGVKLQLEEISNSPSILAETIIPSSELTDNIWVSLTFDPQLYSAGKEYSLAIQASESTTDSNVSPWTIASSPYPLSGLYLDNKKVGNHALCLKTICTR